VCGCSFVGLFCWVLGGKTFFRKSFKEGEIVFFYRFWFFNREKKPGPEVQNN
jgi:hypothetical protein